MPRQSSPSLTSLFTDSVQGVRKFTSRAMPKGSRSGNLLKPVVSGLSKRLSSAIPRSKRGGKRKTLKRSR